MTNIFNIGKENNYKNYTRTNSTQVYIIHRRSDNNSSRHKYAKAS